MNQTDEIKMLVKSLEKRFDDKECTMQLIRDRLMNEQTNQKVDESPLSVEDSFKYRFRNQQDLLSIKFFIVERLTRLAQIKIGYQPKRLIKESENLGNLSILEK